ncbi:nitroreductase/quinone reductase family protein [Krasilnikoviella flava]|uniref:Deazaflavin-dependent oxidoreductase, nitroreductase family n=1 Tax=Krasilnikoviella flava TaxID=526729 RepID=A0A1T5IU64_9MICO|nr:nitroreductase/quinone reductase family protein [Krasilnikoviella flava]SKC42716.1 deazaflavin-dependent oxidoreductase, nitroreductase family [Krasilnikoviella flava]
MARVLHVVRSVVAPVTRTRAFRAVAPVVLPPVERALAWATRGRFQLSAVLVPSLVLHSTGARSGQPRDTSLMYTPVGGWRLVVAGTSFARERHPAWTYNLLAHPDAAVSIRGRRFDVRATLVTGAAERDALWARIEAQWPGYRTYERESGRVVRLFLLARAGG